MCRTYADCFRHAVDDWEVSKMQAKRLIALILAIMMTLAMVGCYGAPLSTREKGTLIGGATGLGAGALVGSAVGSPGAGAAIGGLGGAVAGYGIGNYMQNQQYRQWHNGYY
jgi:outer membrane protein with glycine zipper